MNRDSFAWSGYAAEEPGDQERIERLKAALQMEEQRMAEGRSYLSNWSHDMRTPLHSIIGYATIALENMHDQGNVKECLEQIVSSGREMSELLQEIMHRAKTGDFRTEEEKNQKRWDLILERLCSMMKPKLLEKHLTMKIDMSEVVHQTMEVELFNLQQILWNLVENAIKYTKENGVIVVRVRELDVKKPELGVFEISVQDTGIGIQDDFIPHVYERYVREDRTEVAAAGGEGIGLTAVKRVVDRMKGTIEVESVLDHGTTFTVTLPIPIGEDKNIPKKEKKD